MSSLNPPFRADHVGSLLRPQALLAARRRARDGEISRDQLRQIEDTHVRDVVAKQEAVGLKKKIRVHAPEGISVVQVQPPFVEVERAHPLGAALTHRTP